jgi:uncharacterized protein with FMN-binding domain
MKKFALSAFVLISFVIYSLLQRQRVDASVQGIDPLNNSAQPSSLNSLSTPSASNNNSSTITQETSQGSYKDGQYNGQAYDAYYGYVQVSAQVQNGRLVNISFLQYPNDRDHSVMLSNYSLPILRQEAIQAQSANVNIVSGATDTSLAFRQSLSSALAQAL